MVTHLDIVESKLGFSKFTLNDLAQTLKVSYGLARKYALEWVESGRLHKIRRGRGVGASDLFQLARRKMKDWNTDSMEELERLYEQDALAPGPTEEEVEEVLEHWMGPEDIADISSFSEEVKTPEDDHTVDDLLQQIMEVSSNWKARALTAEKDNDRIKQALADFLVGLKSEDF